MTNTNPPLFDTIVDSVRLPLQHFIETGFWDPSAQHKYHEVSISSEQVRSSCRLMAKHLKRPFILCGVDLSYGEHVPAPNSPGGYIWVQRKVPVFRYGYIELQKRKYLVGHIAPLTLALDGDVVADRSSETLWSFIVRDESLWKDYYQHILTDPDLRRARKLTS